MAVGGEASSGRGVSGKSASTAAVLRAPLALGALGVAGLLVALFVDGAGDAPAALLAGIGLWCGGLAALRRRLRHARRRRALTSN